MAKRAVLDTTGKKACFGAFAATTRIAQTSKMPKAAVAGCRMKRAQDAQLGQTELVGIGELNTVAVTSMLQQRWTGSQTRAM